MSSDPEPQANVEPWGAPSLGRLFDGISALKRLRGAVPIAEWTRQKLVREFESCLFSPELLSVAQRLRLATALEMLAPAEAGVVQLAGEIVEDVTSIRASWWAEAFTLAGSYEPTEQAIDIAAFITAKETASPPPAPSPGDPLRIAECERILRAHPGAAPVRPPGL